MTISFSSEFLQKYPSHHVALGVVRNISVFGPDERSKKILDDCYPLVKEKYQDVDLANLPTSLPYRNLEEQIHAGARFGFPYDQVQRVLDGKGIHNINNVVNTYMTFELMSNLSFSSYDLDAIKGDIMVTLANENETMTLLGGKQTEIPTNDLVFRDDNGIFYSFSKGYTDRTKLSPQTKNVLYTIDAPEGISRDDVEKNIQELCAVFHSTEYFILNKQHAQTML